MDPGGGRFVGLLSIATLPRRLGLDFSDVTDKGLAFDTVKGEFRLDKGNAFTCNLGLAGPVTDIGILGRVSLRDRSYDQLAVVRPHVSDVLAVGGLRGRAGGWQHGAADFADFPQAVEFTRARATTGCPAAGTSRIVTKVQKSEVDLTPFRDCERYLAEALKELPPEAELTR